MSTYTMSTTVAKAYDETMTATREALAEQGLAVLTEIDLAATLKAKLGVDIAPQAILGACRPPLAYEAIQADPSIAAVLPCNVVVRSVGPSATLVEAFDPDAMIALTGNTALHPVATDARQRLAAALTALTMEK